jgi:hypothetical protein
MAARLVPLATVIGTTQCRRELTAYAVRVPPVVAALTGGSSTARAGIAAMDSPDAQKRTRHAKFFARPTMASPSASRFPDLLRQIGRREGG